MEKIYLRDINDNQIEVEIVRFFHFKNTNYLIYTKNETDEKGYIILYPVKVMESLGEKIARSIKDEIEWDNMQSIIKTVIKEIKDEKIESFIDLNTNEIENLKIVDSRSFKLDPKLVEILGSSTMLGIDKSVKLDGIETSIYDENVNENISVEINNEINDTMNTLENININVQEEVEPPTTLITNETTSINEQPENIVENDIWQDKTIDNVRIDDPVDNESINDNNDYKKMYESLLQEKNELSDILTDMVIELTNYKIKYGELNEE